MGEFKNRETLSVVIVGWYFKNLDIYKKLVEEARYYKNLKASFYIASHKTPEEIDQVNKNELKNSGCNLLHFENKGWDWGAYQQFLIWQKSNESFSDYYLFLHDDIKIKKKGFIRAFLEQIQNGAKVVGNGFPYSLPLERVWTKISPHVFFWAKSKGFSIRSKKWRCVRGSCLFTVKEIAENILIKMPIKYGFHPGFGNWSVKIFGGLAQDLYGEKAISYLADKERKSFYIEEEYRGKSLKSSSKKFIYKAKSNISTPLKTFIKKIVRRQKAPPSPSGLKLNLGCGNRYLEGYLNIEIDSELADLKADILDLKFDKNSIAEVLMVHVIEHIEHFKARSFIEKVYNWLKDDGQLVMEFPDIIKVARCILEMQDKPDELQNSPFGIRGF